MSEKPLRLFDVDEHGQWYKTPDTEIEKINCLPIDKAVTTYKEVRQLVRNTSGGSDRDDYEEWLAEQMSNK